MRRRIGIAACAGLLLLAPFQPAWAQRPPPEHLTMGHTLMAGTGFIVTPYAQVKPGLFATGVAVFPEGFAASSDLPALNYTLARGAVGLGLSDWIEAGVTIHGDAVGAFGKVQLMRQDGAFPAIAAGVQNIVTEGRGRFGIEDPIYDNLKDAATFYAVATYVLGPGSGSFPSWVMLSAGFGTGLFLEDNPQIEQETDIHGIFASAAFDFQAAEDAFVRVMGEYDGFDVNLGVMGYVRGLEVSLGLLSVNRDSEPPLPPDPGQATDPTQTFPGSFYNQRKPYASVAVNLGSIGQFPWIFK